MSKITLMMDVSLDMYIADLNGNKDWIKKNHVLFNAFYHKQGALIMGRKTFLELMKEDHWPYKNKEVLVLSSKDIEGLMPVGVKVYSGELLPLLDTLKKKHDQIWLVGGGLTAKTFIEGELLDEVMLNIHPVMLGRGIPLFNPSNRREMELVEHSVDEFGVVRLKYNL